MTDKKKIDTVIFDVGGVLADYRKDDYFIMKGYSGEVAQRLKAVTVDSADWCEYDRGVLTDEEVRNRFKASAPELAEEIDDSLTHMYNLVTKRDFAIPWILSVREMGCRVYILSNFPRTALADCAPALDFQFYADGCFWSSQHKLIKPDSAIFLKMFYEFGIDPECAVFIDDSQSNIDAAEKLGLHTVLYKTRQQAQEAVRTLLFVR